MTPHYADDLVTLYHGDCLDVLRELPDASVDAVVTDPPYGLEFMGKEWDSFKTYAGGNPNMKPQGESVGDSSGVTYGYRQKNPRCRRCGKLMRGNGSCKCPDPQPDTRTAESANQFQFWCEDWATECLRVLKPGGHLLAFGGTRTWHRLACAIEDAGFEVRDSIAWMYGSGFPKSLDVSKAIDRSRGENRARQLEFTAWMRSTGITARQINEATDSFMGSHYLTDRAQAAIATADMFDKLRPLLPEVPERIERLVAERTGIEWTEYVKREVVGTERRFNEPSGIVGVGQGERTLIDRNITAPATPDAERWQGWGTALKPAHEPIVVARKPLGAGTVAANVLEHGTGALNIDGCRIETTDNLGGGAYAANPTERAQMWGEEAGNSWRRGGAGEFQNPSGRWPANVVLDEHTAALLDEQSGVIPASVRATRTLPVAPGFSGGDYQEQPNANLGRVGVDTGFSDTGGASRFFYTAKAGSDERPRVKRDGESSKVAGTPAKTGRECNVCGNRTVPPGGKPWPACGHDDWSTFTTEDRGADTIAHPTVKPLSLMRWLVRLVTPPGGVVLEPFAGSGTTLEACVIEGFRAIGIEREADYIRLIEARLTKPIQPDIFGGVA